jgi:hypothetical protein
MMQLCESLTVLARAALGTNALLISRREIKATAVLLGIFIVSPVLSSSLFRIRSRTPILKPRRGDPKTCIMADRLSIAGIAVGMLAGVGR